MRFDIRYTHIFLVSWINFNKRPYDFSGPYFLRILLHVFPYSVRMQENTDQKDSEYGHFSPSEKLMMGHQFLLAVIWNSDLQL